MLRTQRQTVKEYPMAPTRKTSTCYCIYHCDFVYMELVNKTISRVLAYPLTSNGSKLLMRVKEKLIKEKTYHVKVLGKYFKIIIIIIIRKEKKKAFLYLMLKRVGLNLLK